MSDAPCREPGGAKHVSRQDACELSTNELLEHVVWEIAFAGDCSDDTDGVPYDLAIFVEQSSMIEVVCMRGLTSVPACQREEADKLRPPGG